MKIRAITVGLKVETIDLWNDEEKDRLKSALQRAKTVINSIHSELQAVEEEEK